MAIASRRNHRLQRVFTSGLAACAMSCGLMQTAAAESIVLVDASRAGAAPRVYGTLATPLQRGSTLRFVRLSPPLDRGLECCVRVAGSTRASRDLEAEGAKGRIDSTFASGRLTAARGWPFVAVGFLGQAPATVREDPHTLLLKDRRGVGDRRLVHCLSTETLHVRVIDAASSREQFRYSLPLGMDVEPDCDDHLMPPPK